MNARRQETATFIERVRRVLREPRKLLEHREMQLKQPEQLVERNPESAPKILGNHCRQSEEIPLRTVTARISLRSEGQKTQTLPPEVLGKRIRIIKNKQMPNRRLRRPLKNQKRKKNKNKDPAFRASKVLSDNQSTSASNESFPEIDSGT